MNPELAKEIAKRIGIAQLRQIMLDASDRIQDWQAPSRLNKRISRQVSWNILGRGLHGKVGWHVKLCILLEFGEFHSAN